MERKADNRSFLAMPHPLFLLFECCDPNSLKRLKTFHGSKPLPLNCFFTALLTIDKIFWHYPPKFSA